MTFGALQFLWALALLPMLLIVFLWNEKRSHELMGRLVASRLQSSLAGSVSITKRRVRFTLLLLGLGCTIASLARPQLGYTWEQSHRKGRDILIAVDTSKSMLATDLTPNRLTRAKFAVQDLLKLLTGDRVGLIAFAGNAFLQAPLTIDYSAVLGSVSELDTEIIPRGGTNITEAIKVAAEAFGKGESENRALILFTDGEELEKDAVEAARQQKENFRVFAVGVGTAEGALIPVPNERGGTDFVKDSQGQIVKSKLDETRLKEIAEASGGFYTRLGNGPETMKQIVSAGLGQMQERDIDSRQARRPIERYQWPLGAGLFLLVCSLLINERKRTARGVAFACAMLLPVVGSAKNSGVAAYEKQDYAKAREIFENQLRLQPNSPEANYNIGTAAFQLGKDDEALAAFGKSLVTGKPGLRADAEMNLGNTLYRKGDKLPAREEKLKDWKNAVSHYDEALKARPEDKTVEGYREYVLNKIKELEKEPPKSEQKKQDQDKKDKQDQQKKDQEKQDQQQSKDQQSKDQKDSQDHKQSGSEKQDEKQSQSDQQKQSGADKQDEQQSKPGDKSDEKKPEPSPDEKQSQANAKPGGDQQSPGQPAGTPGPAPSPSDKKLSGEIQAKPSEGKEKPENAAEAQPAEESTDGKMSERQAMMLLDSLKGEDDRVQLNERKQAAAVLKDW